MKSNILALLVVGLAVVFIAFAWMQLRSDMQECVDEGNPRWYCRAIIMD